MPGVLIKRVPNHIHALLKDRAAANRRSLSAEALTILEEALVQDAGPPTLEEIQALRVKGRRPLTQDILDEARQSGRP